MPRELGYLALTALIGWVSIAFFQAAFWAASGLLVVVVGIVIVAGLLVLTRHLGTYELRRLRLVRMGEIHGPTWPRPVAGRTVLRALGDVFANPHAWLYYLHSGLINPILAAVTSTVLFLVWLPVTLVLVTAPVWAFFRPSGGPDLVVAWVTGAAANPIGWTIGARTAFFLFGSVDAAAIAATIAATTLLGMLSVTLLPFLTRGLVWAHWGLARLLLARFPSEAADARVAHADAAQRAAVAAEDTALRRLERDIHDGPQQRLLRLEIELGRAERQLDDPAAARATIAEARTLAQETLDELRALAQGFAPPLLQDRGLAAALEALAGRSSVPIEIAVDLAVPVPPPVERSVYFVAAELTSNAIKHADARHIRLTVATAPGTDGDEATLHLTAFDDGRGGAVVTAHHGLAGATERIAGLGGALAIESPAGGPTTIRARVPLAGTR